MSEDLLQQQQEALDRISKVKFPNLRDADATSGWKIGQLESYLVETAIARQEAHRSKLMVQIALDELNDKWADVEGWEMYLPPKAKDRTAAAITDAKRQASPAVYASIQTCKRLVDRLGEQIRRLERDADTASRVYTLIVGS